MKPTKIAEKRYASDLRKIAKASASLIMSHTEEWKFDLSALKLLAIYAESLTPWAMRTADKMLKDTNSKSDRYFIAQMKAMGKEYNRQLAESVAGQRATELLRNQVDLIKSIPIQAGMRAQDLSQQAASGGRRASEIAEEIARTEEVTISRATLIARTEVAKANATFNQARAESIGSTQYIWRTAEDGDVRESHAELDGKVFYWNNPPCIGEEGCHNPGEIWNCRCYAEPII